MIGKASTEKGVRRNTNKSEEITLEETVITVAKQRCIFIGKKTRKCYFPRHLSVPTSQRL
jgi:hypothetical protein